MPLQPGGEIALPEMIGGLVTSTASLAFRGAVAQY